MTQFNQPIVMQWIIRHSSEAGYIIENVQTKQFLTVEGGDVVSVGDSGKSSRWNLVNEGEDHYKFV